MIDDGTPRRCILGVYAHPDDETSSAAGTFARYSREGVQIYVATATGGEEGSLGAGDYVVRREDLGAVHEAELRSVLQLLGANPPTMLGYRDQGLTGADFEELVGKIVSNMEDVRPDVVLTFGPTGISGHDDHITCHRAAVEAFHRYRGSVDFVPRLYFTAIPEKIANRFELVLDESEMRMTVVVGITEYLSVNQQALRMYRSQEDAQQLAGMLEENWMDYEAFNQIYPPHPGGEPSAGFWE